MQYGDEYWHSLEKSSKKYNCPSCGKKRFTYYRDNYGTGEIIDPAVGMCERLNSCGYHFAPREYFEQTGQKPKSREYQNPANRPIMPQKKPGRLSFDKYVKPTLQLKNYQANKLVSWLATLPGWNQEIAVNTALLYHVGTGRNNVSGWPIYWQVDEKKQVRSGKLMLYNQTTGKRVKDENVYNYDWIHRILQRAGKLPTDESEWSLQQCLFGLHLIRDKPNIPVAIVESEKTALIASQYIPDLIWLSTGTLNGLNVKKLIPLKNRKILLYPDQGKAFQEWKIFAECNKNQFDISVSELLEKKAPDENEGFDIADYLQNFDLRLFPGSVCYSGQNPKNGAIKQESEPEKKEVYPAEWDSVEPPAKGTAEFTEMLLIELSEGIISEFEYWKETDPKAEKLIQAFDLVPAVGLHGSTT